ncbi:MAG TPA: hypothetical protein VFI67_06025 [Sphingomicrobium sp.]|nr:hypothetical protein [Sphingomicrobium sp.]
MALIAAVFIAIVVTSNRSSPYVRISQFAGCYVSADGDKLVLSGDGHIHFNGVAAGSYRVLAPVGGKHGYLVEAEGLELRLSGNAVVTSAGRGGFYWPIDSQTIQVLFAPSREIEMRKTAAGDC